MTLLTPYLLLPTLVLTSFANAYTPPLANCRNLTVPVHITSNNYPWTAAKWTDDFGLTDFVTTAASRPTADFPSPFGNTPTVQNGTYEISATFCAPKVWTANTSTVLLATHGLGFDRSYWNSPYKPDQYNFVQYAVQQGYSVFFYDRLGVGSSSKLSGFENQFNMQLSILSSLISSIRSGRLSHGTPKSIVLIGHSFGSFLSNALVALEPTAAAIDAVILTGYSLEGYTPQTVLEAFAPRVANLQSPHFAPFDPGYVTTRDVYSNINNYFKAPAYEPSVALYSETTKQPFAMAEFISLGSAYLHLNATAYKGAALVISGEYDFIVCGGYCAGELAASFAPLFGGAKDFETYIQPCAGHGLNFAINATGAYGVIFEYLARNGL